VKLDWYSITPKEERKLKKIASRIVVQSHEHRENIIRFYRTLVEEAMEQFREDNRPTLEWFLKECHEEAFKRAWPGYHADSVKEENDKTTDTKTD